MGNGSSSCHAAGSCTVISTAASTSRAVSDDKSSTDADTSTPGQAAGTTAGNVTHRSQRRRRRHRVNKTAAAAAASQMVTVLLLDGRVIRFRRKVTAMQILTNHHNHCLCPAQSLDQTTPAAASGAGKNTVSALFKPISLLPHDLLLPGRVYILIPLPTFKLFASASIAAKKGTMDPNYCKKLPLEIPSSRSKRGPHHLTISKSSAAAGAGATKKCLTRTQSFDLPSKNPLPRNAAVAIMQRHRSHAGGVRRCRSWTPGLQAINEA